MNTANDGCNDRDEKGQAKDSNDDGTLPLPPRARGRLTPVKDDGTSLLCFWVAKGTHISVDVVLIGW